MTCQAITTKFIPATDTRGSRVKATANGGTVTLDYDHAMNGDENHTEAARQLADRLNWRGQWFSGGLPNEGGYCFVCADTDSFAFAIAER